MLAALGAVVEDVFARTDELIASSGPERQRQADLKAVKARNVRTGDKLTSQLGKYNKAKTALGKSYHKGRIRHSSRSRRR